MEAPLQCNGASVAYQRGPRCTITRTPLHINRGPVVCIWRPASAIDGPDKCLQSTTQQAVGGKKRQKRGFLFSISAFSRKPFSMNYFYRARGKENRPVRLPSCMVAIMYGCHHVGPAPAGSRCGRTESLRSAQNFFPKRMLMKVLERIWRSNFQERFSR